MVLRPWSKAANGRTLVSQYDCVVTARTRWADLRLAVALPPFFLYIPLSTAYEDHSRRPKGIVQMSRSLVLPLIALVFCATVTDVSHALTIYRIGGSDLPPPERDAPFDFIQLEWADIDAKQHGSTLLTEVSTTLAPEQLDPTVNLTPLLDERGGKIETLRSIVGWADFPARDAPMFDGDPTTHFLGDGDWGGDYGAIENKCWYSIWAGYSTSTASVSIPARSTS